MKKCAYLQVLVVLSFVFLNQDFVYSDDPGPGELIIRINPSTTKMIKVKAVGTVWGSKDEGYPITHEFDLWQSTSPSFFLQFVDNPGAPGDPTIGYGKYRITIDGNTFEVDYRDCDYEGNQVGPYVCNNADIEVDYDVSTANFSIPVQPSSPLIWVRRCDWVDPEQTPSIPRTDCFQPPPPADMNPPDPPANLVLVNAGQVGQNPQLSWDANTESDLDGYQVWRGLQWGKPFQVDTIYDETEDRDKRLSDIYTFRDIANSVAPPSKSTCRISIASELSQPF